MGILMNINVYAERKKDKSVSIKNLEKNFWDYNNWLKMTNRKDKLENYEEFLKAQ